MLFIPYYHDKIMANVVSIYEKCNITTFPFHCISILEAYGFRIYTYEQLREQNLRLYQMCISYSTDSFRFKDMIAYNEQKNSLRIRFSLMHELGHIVLGHEIDNQTSEDEANYFASNILAPRIIIHKGQYRTAEDIHLAFGLSYDASNRALASYKDWLRNITYSKARTPSEPELQLEQMFFPPEPKTSPARIVDEEENTQHLDPTEKYLLILRIINAGLPVPPEYKKDVQWYKRKGFRLR